jgi:peptidyl-tRNA hydrolase
MSGRDYVLSRPTDAERNLIDKAENSAVDAVMVWVTEGVEAAMSRFNRKTSADGDSNGEKNLL